MDTLFIDLSKRYKIWKSSMQCLSTKKKKRITKWIADYYHREMKKNHSLTFLKVSRQHTIFPKDRMCVVCWVCAINSKYTRFILSGSKYQSYWYSLSLRTINCLLTFSPMSQTMKKSANIKVTTFIEDASSDRFNVSCDYK